MPFTGKEDHFISIEEAQKLVSNYQSKIKESDIKAYYVGKDSLQKVLQQDGCVGVRIYFGEDEEGKLQLVIVGVNSEEKDLDEGYVLERFWPCPPYCNKESKLMQK